MNKKDEKNQFIDTEKVTLKKSIRNGHIKQQAALRNAMLWQQDVERITRQKKSKKQTEEKVKTEAAATA